jgi:ribosomal protein L37AE/L43A
MPTNKQPAKPAKPTVRCPKCNRPQPKRGGHDSIYYCEHCRCQFDDDPTDGGDYSDRNPAARLERQERFKATQRERKARRR